MIQLTGVSKFYKTLHGTKTVLDNVNLTIAPGEHVGILGRNGAGKSTLVRIIGGADTPSIGEIHRGMTVSWPLAFTGGFQTALTGADNLRFICRIYNVDYKKQIDYVKEFSELGTYLYEPVRTYSSGMRAKLAFGISMSIDFDCYLIDEVIAVGDESFRDKCRVELFEKRSHKAMIIVSHSHRYLKDTCDRFLLLRNAKIEEFTDFREGYEQYRLMMGGSIESELPDTL
jgi:capsular polysaccharide transport system ATP-binding protein